jgi:hypothetical protein
MLKRVCGCLLIVLNFQLYAAQQSWVGFYNLENLFDTISNVGVEDEDRTPHGRYRWTTDRMEQKIKKLHSVIDSINKAVDPYEWSLLGVCEVENAALIDQLCKRFNPSQNCRYVHFESPDLRGIDVALLYNAKRFRPTHFERKKVKLFLSDDTPKYTRDLLVVSGWLTQVKVHFIVAHWPSRSGFARVDIALLVSASLSTNEKNSVNGARIRSTKPCVTFFQLNGCLITILFLLK